jgi:Kef-type K+ transport system membrane component KefB
MAACARLAGFALVKLRQPSVVGELAAGTLLGPAVFGLLDPAATYGPYLEAVAQVGIVVLLFTTGLETPPARLRKVGAIALRTATAGVLTPLALGAGLMLALGYALPAALFIGAALVATSVGITARVLADLKEEASLPGTVILGAAVMDDVMGLLVLALVGAIAAGGAQGPFGVAAQMGAAAVFVTAAFYVGPAVVRRWLSPRPGRLPRLAFVPSPSRKVRVLVAALAACAVLSLGASWVQLAPIVGAFLAGVAFAEVSARFGLRARLESPRRALVPLFFVLMGAHVSFAALAASPGLLALGGTLLALACAAKYYPCRFAARRLGRWPSHVIGIGMMPRGEVGLIVGAVALSAGVIGPDLFSVVVLVSIGSSLAAPPLLRRAMQTPAQDRYGQLKVARATSAAAFTGPPTFK